MIPFEEIDVVLLDMDGTLLDKYFDDYFWEHLVPQKYAERHNITFKKAKKELFKRYKSQERTLNWTDIDFWSRDLDLDIPALKEQIKHLIEVHPNVEEFLQKLKSQKKSLYLITNAHYKVLDLKMKKTDLGKYFDRCITSFEIGYPKELLQFWKEIEKIIEFNREKTLFIDDTPEILRTAKDFGIKYLLLKIKANSKKQDNPQTEFPYIKDFKELL